ncbi:hypothetical protein HaLaN_31493, partial [Haematococcus lacustris]
MAKKKRKSTAKQKQGLAKKLKASRSPQGKRRQERRDGWGTKRRQVKGRHRVVCPRTVCVPASYLGLSKRPVKDSIVLCRKSSRSRVALCCAAAERRSG